MKTYKDFVNENFEYVDEEEMIEAKPPPKRLKKSRHVVGGKIVKDFSKQSHKGYSKVTGTNTLKKQTAPEKFRRKMAGIKKGRKKVTNVAKLHQRMGLRKRKQAGL